ncbi:hypothetical protein D3C79_937540 [compost metagenome]
MQLNIRVLRNFLLSIVGSQVRRIGRVEAVLGAQDQFAEFASGTFAATGEGDAVGVFTY